MYRDEDKAKSAQLKSGVRQSQLNLLQMLIMLTLLAMIAQISFVYIHYKTMGLVNTLLNSSFIEFVAKPVIFLPILQYIAINLLAYAFLIFWIWFIATSLAGYRLGLLLWCNCFLMIASANNVLYPHSFFSLEINHTYLILVLLMTSGIMVSLTGIAFMRSFQRRQRRGMAASFMIIFAVALALQAMHQFSIKPANVMLSHAMPNIIIIGIDSLRPDQLDYFHGQVHTPHLDQFLSSATVFNQAYTPLARTFPSWISILTSRYPLHSQARNNLADAAPIQTNPTLAKRLQALGYETIYATDEKRFSNISKAYGFDKIVGPKMGLNDFIIGGLGDFPVSNLLVNLTLTHQFFPFNYANRAAAVTYEPNNFLRMVEEALQKPSDKPLFLAVHFCLTHWPYIWSTASATEKTSALQAYQTSIQVADDQFGKLLRFLNQAGATQHAIIVVVSDHGTALGLLGDQVVAKENFIGKLSDMRKLEMVRLSSANPLSMDYQRDYSINTTYGQGTSVLSLTQTHVLLAMQGIEKTPATVSTRASLLDVTPTILDALHQPSLPQSDGYSLLPIMQHDATFERPLFFETGDKIAEIMTDQINPEKVVQQRIYAYVLDPSGKLYMNTHSEASLIRNKQLGIMWQHWLLVEFPPQIRSRIEEKDHQIKMVNYWEKPYEVFVNLQTQKWSVGFSPVVADKATYLFLKQALQTFYS